LGFVEPPGMKRTLQLWSGVLRVWSSIVFAGDCTYRNPVLLGEFPDPSVIRVGRDYYATATETGWAPLFSIAQSTDLIHWRIVGAVWLIAEPARRAAAQHLQEAAEQRALAATRATPAPAAPQRGLEVDGVVGGGRHTPT